MRNLVKIILLCACALTVMSCVSSAIYQPLLGHSTQQAAHGQVGSSIGPGRILKRGESCSTSSYLFAIAFVWYGAGNSVSKAMQNGGITKVGVIDRSSTTILGPIFYRDCVVVWGE